MRQSRQDQHRNCASVVGESTIVSQLFEGQLSYMTICMHCDHQALTPQSFTVLSLPIPTAAKCSIQVGLPAEHYNSSVCVYFVFIVTLSCAGLPVSVLRADYPHRWRADAVFSVWGEERNCSPHLFGQNP